MPEIRCLIDYGDADGCFGQTDGIIKTVATMVDYSLVTEIHFIINIEGKRVLSSCYLHKFVHIHIEFTYTSKKI
jgi:hypothetical protein